MMQLKKIYRQFKKRLFDFKHKFFIKFLAFGCTKSNLFSNKFVILFSNKFIRKHTIFFSLKNYLKTVALKKLKTAVLKKS